MCIHTRKLAGAFVCLDENNDGCLILRPFLYLIAAKFASFGSFNKRHIWQPHRAEKLWFIQP